MDLEFLDTLSAEFELRGGTNWFQASLGPGGSDFRYEASPALRGPYTVGPLLVRRTDALRLRVQQSRVDAGQALEVAPRREPVNRSPFKTRVPTVTLGPHLVNRAGDGSEFHSLREYHEGDSFRAINWKASARSTSLVVSQRVHESRTTLTLFLDARAVSAAGPACDTPLAHGCRVVLYGDGVNALAEAPGPRQVHELTQALARLAAAGSTPFATALAAVLPSLKPGTPVLLVSCLEGDPSVVEGMRLLRAKGLLPMVIASPVATAPTDPAEGGPEPGEAGIRSERERMLSALRGAGVPVVDALPGVSLDYLFRVGATA
jgi:uncharacterized protein (DUF58 family)